MKKVNVEKYFKMVTRFAKKRSPEILTGIGIAGMITTTVLAVKATPKALELIEDEKRERNRKALAETGAYTTDANLKPVEVVEVAWKPYIPAVLLGTASVACLIGANSVHARRQAALYSAYKLSETALSEYKDKVLEVVGEEKEKEVREEIAKDKLEKNPVSKTEVYVTGNGKSLFYDPLSDRYFESDIETIRKAVNDLNYSMGFGSEIYVSLSQLYDEIGLNHTGISDQIGWNIDDGLIEVDLTEAKITDDGKPCIVMDWVKIPVYNFDRVY